MRITKELLMMYSLPFVAMYLLPIVTCQDMGHKDKESRICFKSNEHSIIYDSLNLRQLFRTSHHVDSW